MKSELSLHNFIVRMGVCVGGWGVLVCPPLNVSVFWLAFDVCMSVPLMCACIILMWVAVPMAWYYYWCWWCNEAVLSEILLLSVSVSSVDMTVTNRCGEDAWRIMVIIMEAYLCQEVCCRHSGRLYLIRMIVISQEDFCYAGRRLWVLLKIMMYN